MSTDIGQTDRKDSRAFKKLYDNIARNFESAHRHKAQLHEELRQNRKALGDLFDSGFDDPSNSNANNAQLEQDLNRKRNELQVRLNNVELAWAQSVKKAHQHVWEANEILTKACDMARRSIVAGEPDEL